MINVHNSMADDLAKGIVMAAAMMAKNDTIEYASLQYAMCVDHSEMERPAKFWLCEFSDDVQRRYDDFDFRLLHALNRLAKRGFALSPEDLKAAIGLEESRPALGKKLFILKKKN